jgi:hypothetical protein
MPKQGPAEPGKDASTDEDDLQVPDSGDEEADVDDADEHDDEDDDEDEEDDDEL